MQVCQARPPAPAGRSLRGGPATGGAARGPPPPQAGATGLEPAAVRELERFGLLTGRDLGGTTYFDAEALAARLQ